MRKKFLIFCSWRASWNRKVPSRNNVHLFYILHLRFLTFPSSQRITFPSSQRITIFSRNVYGLLITSCVHTFILHVSKHKFIYATTVVPNAMGCTTSFNNRIEVLLSVAPDSNPRIREIPISEEKKCILRESWKLIEPVKSTAGKKMFIR